MNEEWRTIEGYPRYEVSSFGRVRHKRLGKIRKPVLSWGPGYPMVNLRTGGRDTTPDTLYIHHLVAHAFMGPRPPGPEGAEINHKDGDKTNNLIENLEYCSRRDNHAHASRIGLLPPARARLTPKQVLQIRTLALSEVEPQRQIAERYGISQTHVSKIKTGDARASVVNAEGSDDVSYV